MKRCGVVGVDSIFQHGDSHVIIIHEGERVIETELHQSETAAFQAQALIEEARRLHRRRQKKLALRLLAAVLLLGIAVSVVVLTFSRSQSTANAPPRLGPTRQASDTAYITTSDGILKVNLPRKRMVGRITSN